MCPWAGGVQVATAAPLHPLDAYQMLDAEHMFCCGSHPGTALLGPEAFSSPLELGSSNLVKTMKGSGCTCCPAGAASPASGALKLGDVRTPSGERPLPSFQEARRLTKPQYLFCQTVYTLNWEMFVFHVQLYISEDK